MVFSFLWMVWMGASPALPPQPALEEWVCQAEPLRLRTVLDSGAIVLVEPRPGSTISVQLFATDPSLAETPKTHGLRHLIEHLTLKGGAGDLDRRLETEGALLSGSTLRDTLRIGLIVPAGRLDLAWAALAEVTAPLEIEIETLARETEILGHELRQVDHEERLASAAWSLVYGSAGLDPLGSLSVIEKLTREQVREAQQRLFRQEHLTIAIVGPVDLDKATAEARAFLESRPKGERGVGANRGWPTKPGGLREIEEVRGEARSAPVPGFSDPKAASTLAAALALASELSDGFVIYTPSAQPGLVTLGHGSADPVLEKRLDGLSAVEVDRLFERGRALARAWTARQLQTSEGVAFLRGLLLSQDPAFRPEAMLQNLDAMRLSDFRAAVASFRAPRAFHVRGKGR